MATSGEQSRPARVLVVAACLAVDRVVAVLRSEGHIVELATDAGVALARLGANPPVDILVTNGADDVTRARVLAAARDQNVWCIHLRADPVPATLPSVQRAELLAALPLDADEARIARTLRLIVAARRSKSAG